MYSEYFILESIYISLLSLTSYHMDLWKIVMVISTVTTERLALNSVIDAC